MQTSWIVGLHHATALLYLAAGALAGAGMALSQPRLVRASVATLGAGAILHAACFSLIHVVEGTPSLTDAPSAISFMAWIGVLAFLLLLRRARLAGLLVLVAPMAFLGVFYASLRLSWVEQAPAAETGSVPHAHVLLASAGLALLGLSGLSGALFLAEHRRIKRKRALGGKSGLPSLEALNRVNAVALAVGFPLLTLGVITGALWVEALHGSPWQGSLHEIFTWIAWAIYAVLVVQRFGIRQGARPCAVSAIAGFGFLCFAVIGVGLFT